MTQLTALLHNFHVLLMIGSALLTLTVLRVAVVSWQDAIKLDGEERHAVARLLNPLTARLAPQTDIEIREARLRLARAGFRGEHALRNFTLVRTCTILGAGLAMILLATVGKTSLTAMASLAAVALICLRGPDYVVDKRVLERKTRINRSLSATIDLMVLCLDVGLSVEAAFERVTVEIRSVEPLMADEAAVVSAEMGAGLTFTQAFKRMADRVDLEELTTLARLIQQASQLGASITQALREYSESAFTKRMLSLEEHAGKVSAYLVMPLTLCFLPACMLALIAPTIIQFLIVLGH